MEVQNFQKSNAFFKCKTHGNPLIKKMPLNMAPLHFENLDLSLLIMIDFF